MTAKIKNTPGSQFLFKTSFGCSLYMLITDDTHDYSFLYLYVDLGEQRSALKRASSLLFRGSNRAAEALNVCF